MRDRSRAIKKTDDISIKFYLIVLKSCTRYRRCIAHPEAILSILSTRPIEMPVHLDFSSLLYKCSMSQEDVDT